MNSLIKVWLLVLTVNFIYAKPEPGPNPEPQLLTLGTLGVLGALGVGAGALGASALNSYTQPQSSGNSRPTSLTNLLLNPLGLNIDSIDSSDYVSPSRPPQTQQRPLSYYRPIEQEPVRVVYQTERPTVIQYQTRPPQPPVRQQVVAATTTTKAPVRTTTTTTTTTATNPPPPVFIQKDSNQDVENVCGIPGRVSTSLIYNGRESEKGKWPWITALLQSRNGVVKFFCGGSLIDHRRVISAAHCVDGLNKRDVILSFGRHDITNYAEENSVNSKVDKILIHPDYSEDATDADIAILITQKFIEFSSYIKPVCIWQTTDDLVGQKGVVAGWGSTESLQVAQVLQEAEITIRTKSYCWNEDNAFKFIVTDYKICAGGDSGVPCFGDSGSGLVVKRNSQWTLRGVVSATLDDNGRCTRTKLTAYTDVAKFTQWTEESKNYL